MTPNLPDLAPYYLPGKYMTNDRPIRVCYHLQTHTNPDQVARLVETVKRGSPDSAVVISHDEKARPLDTSRLERWPGVKVLLHPAVYGDFTHLDRLFAAVDWLNYHGVDFDWLENLTGQDYPLRSISDIEKALLECEHDGFLQYAPVFPKQTPATSDWGAGPGYRLCEPLDARLRYKYRNWRVTRPTPFKQQWLRPLMALNLVQPWVSVSLAFGSVGVRRTSTIFSDDFICYGGSFSCTLSARSVYYARDSARENPFIVSFFNGVLGADEIFLQTVLVNAQKFTFEPTNKWYIDFTGSRNNHPRILGVGDLESMLRSGHHWARKFSSSYDVKVLDLIDDHIGADDLMITVSMSLPEDRRASLICVERRVGRLTQRAGNDFLPGHNATAAIRSDGSMDDLIAAMRSVNQRPPIGRQDRHGLYPVSAHFGRERILDIIPSLVRRLDQDDDRLTGSFTVTADTVAASAPARWTRAVDVRSRPASLWRQSADRATRWATRVEGESAAQRLGAWRLQAAGGRRSSRIGTHAGTSPYQCVRCGDGRFCVRRGTC